MPLGMATNTSAPSRCPVMRAYRASSWLFLAIFAALLSPASALMQRTTGGGGGGTRRLVRSHALGCRTASGARTARALCSGAGPHVKAACHRGRATLPMMFQDASAAIPHHPSMMADGGGGSGNGAVLVLGAGWVGSRLANSLIDEGTPVVVTHRPTTELDKKPPYFRPVPLEGRAPHVAFELSEPGSWANLPPPESLNAVVVTFALGAAPEAFWEQYLSHVRTVLFYSSTSVYHVDTPGQVVDERTPVKGVGRAAAEAFVLERGATVLTVSGIFGERRSPRGKPERFCLSSYTSAGGVLFGPLLHPELDLHARAHHCASPSPQVSAPASRHTRRPAACSTATSASTWCTWTTSSPPLASA